MTSSSASVTVIRDVEGVESMRDEWNELARSSGSPMLDHAWIVSCARTFHPNGDLRVVLLRDNGVLVGIAPLAVDRARGRGFVHVGADILYEPGGWIFSSDAALDELASVTMSLGERVVLPRVPESSPLCGVFAKRLSTRALSVARPCTPSHTVDTSNRDWPTFCAALSARTRNNLRASLWRAEQDGTPTIATHSPGTPAEADALLDAFMTVEQSGWKGRQRSALGVRPDLHCFFREYCRRAAERRELRFVVLSIGSRAAAVEVSVEAHHRLWGLKIAYSERESLYAPALQVVHASIREAFTRGLRSYEFLGVAEPWQRRWKPTESSYKVLVLYPYNARGFIGAGSDLFRFLARGIGVRSPRRSGAA